MEAGGIGRNDPTAGASARGAGGGVRGGPGIQDPTIGETGRTLEALRRPVTADPGPLGLAGFALTTFVLSVYNAGAQNPKGLPVVLGLALFYGGAVQVLAGMWEFRTGNTFGAVAFSSYGGFWLSFWALEQFYAKDLTGTVGEHAVALYLTGWAFFTFYMFIASLRTTGAIAVVFLLLTITYALLAAGDYVGSTTLVRAGGAAGIATAAAAWYASFAAVVNATFKRTVAPVVPLSSPEPAATTHA